MTVTVPAGMTAAEQEATEVGRSHGYAHANYVNAYGGDANAEPEVPPRFAAVAAYYTAGYADGAEQYENDWYDGELFDEED